MTVYAITRQGDWVELYGAQDVVNDDVVASFSTILMWSDDERAAWGIKAILESDIPPGKIATGSTLIDDDGEPRRSWVLEDEPPPPVPNDISDRQFAQQLAVLGTITEAEAIAWAARGDLPVPLESAVAALPVEQQFAARMLLSSATVYERSHALVPMLGAILGYNSGQIDDLWRAAALL